MVRITLKDKDLELLASRYRTIAGDISTLAFGINQIINRLEMSLLASGDIDIRLTSTLRNLQNCEEKIGMLISQITVALERFDESNKKLMCDSNELIYEFKQILFQSKSNSTLAAPDKSVIERKRTIENFFDVKGQITSAKVGYIADMSGIKTINKGQR